MLPGGSGLFGGGMYFAESGELAMHKAQYDGILSGAAVLIVAVVDFGNALVVEVVEK
jgi:hypothetical protein